MSFNPGRRRLLLTAAFLPSVALVPKMAWSAACTRELAFRHLHTGEKLHVAYCENGRYLPDALDAVNNLFRDFRSGDVHPIDPALLDLLADLKDQTGGREYQIISAYRSPSTNAMLRQHSGGVAQRSLHMDGKAIDINLAGVGLPQLRRAAVKLRVGGVGYYPQDGFVHVDTGRVRYW